MPATIPVDLINRALDECGVDPLDDLTSGTDAALTAERVYWPTLRQLLSAAHWNFARKQNAMVQIGKAGDTDTPSQWGYMYEWPVDCVHPRWVPQSYGAADTSGVPIFSAETTVAFPTGTYPAPFIVGSVPLTNEISSDWFDVEGHDPEQTRVILTNQPSAQLIYTGLMQYPDAWDPLFEQAMVSALAVRLSMRVVEDKKLARVIRADNMQMAREALNAARVRDGNEGWTVNDHTPDWMRARVSSWGYNGPGQLFYPWSYVSWLETVY